MEGQVKSFRCGAAIVLSSILSAVALLLPFGYAQEAPSGKPEEAAQLRLRKTPVKTRLYQGKTVEGEEKVVRPGDSLWRYGVQEKGLPDKLFGRYLVLVGSLNPHVKDLNILRVGDTIFIPIKPDEILGIQVPSAKGQPGQPKVYRVKKGDYLFKILRDEFGARGKTELLGAFEQVKGLNPRKKDWNILFVGEAVVLPRGEAPRLARVDPTKPTDVVGLDYGHKLPAQANLDLLEQVVGALGHETQRRGEEVVTLREGKVHLDRDAYPVIHNPKSAQKVILDLGEKIPPALRGKLESERPATPVVSVKKGASLHDAVSSLLSRLGFQSLPANRPVAVQDRGVGLQVKGEWMVTGSEQPSGTPEVFIISLTDVHGRTPEYIRTYLSLKGMNLKEILLPSSPLGPVSLPGGSKGAEIERWPAEKKAMVDSLLGAYQIAFSADHVITVSVQEGIRLDTKADRYFEAAGRKVAVFFYPVGDAVTKALQEKNGIRAVEMDLQALSSREIIARVLDSLGQRAAYRENRFSATGGGSKDKVVITVPGFLLADRSLLITDREIPRELEPFFAEKALKVVYFH
ncbi:MAG: hypothetical protein HYV04_06555 [Deltaproteobacteria bacterium]|nr:hypothetical protein [Deltaproteobacteria bacterium]